MSKNKKTKKIHSSEKYIDFDSFSLDEASKFAFKNTGKFGKDDIDDLRAVIGVLPLRHQALIDAIRRFQETDEELNFDVLTPKQQFNLATIDIFVEKAQFVLTRRSDRLFKWGVVSIGGVIFLLISTYVIAFIISYAPSNDISTNLLILKIFQSIALSAYIYVTVKYLIALGRSFLHEASVLRERRHSLRFGRLFAYLKKGDVTLKELQDSFDWNRTTNTSFLDVNPSTITETLLHKVADAVIKAPTETIKIIAEQISKTTKGKS